MQLRRTPARAHSALAFRNGNKYTGKERDAESGLDDFVARYYTSALGRFVIPDWSAGEDPVPYAKFDNPQSLNLYAYVWNNPLNKTDPLGHCTVDGEKHGSVWCWAHKHKLFGVETQHERAQDLRNQMSPLGIYQNGKKVDWSKLSDKQVFQTAEKYFEAYLSGRVLFLNPAAALSVTQWGWPGQQAYNEAKKLLNEPNTPEGTVESSRPAWQGSDER